MFDQVLQITYPVIEGTAVYNIMCEYAAIMDENGIPNKMVWQVKDPLTNTDGSQWVIGDSLQSIVTPNTLIIYHYSFSTPFSALLPTIHCPQVLLYHNVAPPEFFTVHATHMYPMLIEGLREVTQLAPHFPYAWGDSAYNCAQLREAGFARTAVASPPYDFSRFANVPGEKPEKRGGKKNILFVGRIAPNKRQEDIIRAFSYYHRINPDSELTLVGDFSGFEGYYQELCQLAAGLSLPVNLTGLIPLVELAAHYRNADLFLCMSEHEGFCVPVIEAMYFEVPVIAFDSSAVTETVADAGIVFRQKHFPSVAHLMDKVLTDPALQGGMKAAGRERARYFAKENASKRLIRLIEDYAAELGI